MAIISFKSKYIAVAVIAAVVVSLAVGFVLVFENRAQHTELLDTAAADTRSRVLGELTLRASDVSRHIAERVGDSVLTGDRDAITAQVESFKRDGTMLGIVVRNPAGRELYAWHRPGDTAGGIGRSAIAPVRASVQTLPGITTHEPSAKWKSKSAPSKVRLSPPPARTHFDSMERGQIRDSLIIAGGLGIAALALGFALAWWAGWRMHLPITTLIKSADHRAR